MTQGHSRSHASAKFLISGQIYSLERGISNGMETIVINDFINHQRLVEIQIGGGNSLEFKNVKVSLQVWSKERIGGNREKIETLKSEAMRWELEEGKRTLSDSERGEWLQARKCWEDKEGNIAICFGKKQELRLNVLVNEAVEKVIFRGVMVGSNNVMVSHLQYADDTIFFEEWSKENAKSLMCILKCFEEVSGLRINFKKSKIYGIGVNEGKMTDMARWMGYDIREFPFTYLGLPIRENIRRVNAWNPVVEKFKKRLSDLKAKTEEINGLGVDFTSSCIGVLGDGRDIRFWVNRWVDNRRLCDRFPRLYHLERRKEVRVLNRGVWVDNNWVWEWDWIWSIRDEDGVFTVKELTRLIEEKILISDNGGQETLWNKLVPKKVNIFTWRALRGRLSVRVELDKRGVDLDSVLCLSCDNIVETCAHCLINCDLTMSVWDKIFNWWDVGIVNAFTIDEVFSSNGNINVPDYYSQVWQAVILTTGFLLGQCTDCRRFLSSGTVSLGHFQLCFFTSDRLQLLSSVSRSQLCYAVSFRVNALMRS
ncbi:reverse transcriptase domain, reverse transcriptase zinc-binding domain protein [Tanacetum coccineum]